MRKKEKGVIKEVGHLQGFTYMPKFTHRESLTPESPNLIGAMEPHTLNYFSNIVIKLINCQQ